MIQVQGHSTYNHTHHPPVQLPLKPNLNFGLIMLQSTSFYVTWSNENHMKSWPSKNMVSIKILFQGQSTQTTVALKPADDADCQVSGLLASTSKLGICLWNVRVMFCSYQLINILQCTVITQTKMLLYKYILKHFSLIRYLNFWEMLICICLLHSLMYKAFVIQRSSQVSTAREVQSNIKAIRKSRLTGMSTKRVRDRPPRQRLPPL